MENINFSMLFRIFMKRLWVLVLAFIIAITAAWSYCEYVVTPIYSAKASILATNGAITAESDSEIQRKSVLSADIAASLELVETIINILGTPEAYDNAAKFCDNKYSADEFKNAVSVSRRSEKSLFIDISFKHKDKDVAIEMANIFSESACKYVPKMIPNSNASLAAKAVSATLIYPRTVSTMLTVGIFAMAIVYVLFLIPEVVNRVIRNEEDFTKSFDLPIIGSIPDFENTDAGTYAAYKKGK